MQLEGKKLLNARIGNVMWRSPEGQTGKGIGKPSDVFSYGLFVSWTNRRQKAHLLNITHSSSMSLRAWKLYILTSKN